MLLILGLVFHPVFLSAAEEAAPAAAEAVVAEEDADLDAVEDVEDWELGKDDLAAEDEDLLLEDEDAAATDAAVPAVPAVNNVKPV